MIIYTAQRVLAGSGLSGINAFRRQVQGGVESDAAIKAVHVEVPPGGNRVRSYLDVTSPDTQSMDALLDTLDEIASSDAPAALPMEVDHRGLHIRFGCELGLAPWWRDELRELARHLSLAR